MLTLDSRSKPAFSMVEVLVGLAILAVLTSVMIPALNGKMRDSRTSAISQSLNGISLGMAEYKKAMGRYPGELVFLATNPTTAATDICGIATTASSTALWRGPYISREFLAGGIPMGDGLIRHDVRRLPTTVTSTPPTLVFALLDVTGVETSIAQDLDIQLDGVSGTTTGTLRYTPAAIAAQTGAGVNQTLAIAAAAAGTVTLTYAIPINPTGC